MKPGPIIPSNVASLKSLTVTMAVMSYLACLAIGALILVDRAVTSWTSGLAREMTVQVRQVKSADIEVEVEKVRVLLDGFPGIVAVEVLGQEIGAKLLEPWLGTRSLEGLPVSLTSRQSRAGLFPARSIPSRCIEDHCARLV